MRFPFITQADFYGSRGLRELSVSTTGATTTLAGSGVRGFKDDDVGTNAQFDNPAEVAIDPSGTFALVAVRAWPPAPRASWLSPAAAPLPRTHAPGPHRRPLRWWPPRHTPPPPACSSLSVCSRPTHRRTMDSTAFAVSTSAPERPPLSPAAASLAPTPLAGMGGASRTTTSAPASNSTFPLASKSTRAAPLRSLLCVPGPLHPARRGLPLQRRPRLAHTRPRPAPPPSKVWWPPPHAAPPAFAPRSACVLAPDASQDAFNNRIR
eukprot:scaffold96327_cov60-Phaeocystis_antarctica.AAC.2